MAKLSQFYYLTTFFAITVNAINCYECTSGQDRTCGHYVGTSCAYGFFGCVKIGLLMDFPNSSYLLCSVIVLNLNIIGECFYMSFQSLGVYSGGVDKCKCC